ncbi:hypothetical protein FQN60_016365, partial [Etheostoma spectabile]
MDRLGGWRTRRGHLERDETWRAVEIGMERFAIFVATDKIVSGLSIQQKPQGICEVWQPHEDEESALMTYGCPPLTPDHLASATHPSNSPDMDLHRAAFKMESSSYLPNPLASPALMVLASTAEASRDASIPCQQPRPFGVPVSVEKDVHLPFNNGSYTFASMYHRQGAVPPGFPNRDFPPSLLHLHHQFAPPNLDCSPISMLNHSGVGAFRPFASPQEDRDGVPGGYQSAFTPAKRLKGCLDADASPHLRYSDAEGKEYDFGGSQIPPGGSPSSALKAVEDSGKKIFAVSGLLSDRETSSSPEDRIERYHRRRHTESEKERDEVRNGEKEIGKMTPGGWLGRNEKEEKDIKEAHQKAGKGLAEQKRANLSALPGQTTLLTLIQRHIDSPLRPTGADRSRSLMTYGTSPVGSLQSVRDPISVDKLFMPLSVPKALSPLLHSPAPLLPLLCCLHTFLPLLPPLIFSSLRSTSSSSSSSNSSSSSSSSSSLAESSTTHDLPSKTKETARYDSNHHDREKGAQRVNEKRDKTQWKRKRERESER